MFKNITIRTRLIFVLSLLSVVSVFVGIVGLFNLSTTNNALKTVYEHRLVTLGYLNEVSTLIQQNQLTVGRSLSGDPSRLGEAADAVEQRIGQITAIVDKYMATGLNAEEQALAAAFMETRKKFVNLGLKRALVEMRNEDLLSATEIFRGPITSLFEPLRNDMKALIQLQLDMGKKEYEQAQSRFDLARAVLLAVIAAGLLIGAIVGTLITRGISRSLNEAVRFAEGISRGDLTQAIRIQSTDEVGKLLQALRQMNESLVRTVSQVRTGTDTIATGSSQIAAGNQDLSSRTEQQASSLEETASSMEELTSTVKQNADNARQANQLAVTASGVAVKGGEVVSQVVTTMESINESARKIVDIIGVIDGIAFQTNILALNAAVEAARAGEQGRGFAVVASEVRNLAQRSAAAAKEIKGLIGDSVEKVDAGSKLVGQAGSTMDEIVESVKRVTDIMAEIMAASQEQSAGIEQVNQAIGQMDQVTQQNAALVEQAAAAAESLQEQAGNLAQVVSVFKLDGMQVATRASVERSAGRHPAKPAAAPKEQKTQAAAPAVAATARQKLAAPTTASGDDWEEF
jgi:methyl-accepting chemotaxis protein